MPISIGVTTLNDTTTDPTTQIEQVFGIPTAPPPSPSAPVTVSSSPNAVSSAPVVGQAVAVSISNKLDPSVIVQAIPVVTADPVSPLVGQIWYRSDLSQLSIRHDSGTTKRVTFA